MGSLKKCDRRGKTIPRDQWAKIPGTFLAVYTVNGKRITKSLKTSKQTEAQRELEKLVAPYLKRNEAEKLRQIVHELEDAQADAVTAAEALRNKLTVANAWSAYIESPDRPQSGPKTLSDYEGLWQKFADWWALHAPERPYLEDVQREDVGPFARYLAGQVGAARYNRGLSTCRRLYRVLEDFLPPKFSNPFANTRCQAMIPQGRRALSEDELLAICSRAEGEMRLLLALGLYTAMRLGDCCRLRWEEVSLAQGRIGHVPSKTQASTGKCVLIPIHPTLRLLLEETPEGNRRGFILPEYAAAYGRSTSTVSLRLQKHFRSCGIETRREGATRHAAPEVSFHSLRHSFISQAAKAGVPLAIVRELAGHSSEAIQRYYLHFGEDDTRAAILAQPDIVARPLAPAPPALPSPPSDAMRLARLRARLLQETPPSALVQELLGMLGD